MDNKTTYNSQDLQGQCLWKGNIKDIEVKGQGHFAI